LTSISELGALSMVNLSLLEVEAIESEILSIITVTELRG